MSTARARLKALLEHAVAHSFQHFAAETSHGTRKICKCTKCVSLVNTNRHNLEVKVFVWQELFLGWCSSSGPIPRRHMSFESIETPSKKENQRLFRFGYESKPWYLVNPKIAGKWMFIPLKMVLIGIDPYPFQKLTFWNPSIMCKIQKWPHQKAHKLA